MGSALAFVLARPPLVPPPTADHWPPHARRRAPLPCRRSRRRWHREAQKLQRSITPCLSCHASSQSCWVMATSRWPVQRWMQCPHWLGVWGWRLRHTPGEHARPHTCALVVLEYRKADSARLAHAASPATRSLITLSQPTHPARAPRTDAPACPCPPPRRPLLTCPTAGASQCTCSTPLCSVAGQSRSSA